MIPERVLMKQVFRDDPSVVERLDDDEVRRRVNAVLAMLTPREEKVLRMRFGIGAGPPPSDADAAETVARIRKIEAAAFARLGAKRSR